VRRATDTGARRTPTLEELSMRSFLVITRRQAVCLVGLIGAQLVCLHVVPTLIPKPVHFHSLREFKGFADANGLFSYQNGKSDMCWNTFVVADHPLTSGELRALKSVAMRDCGVGPAWRGVLFVSEIEIMDSYAHREALAGKSRRFGRLVVAGDEAFMNHVERLYRAH
jgi:hypothetical protein